MSAPKTKTPTPTTNAPTLTAVLCPQKLKGLQPGGPDLPCPQRSSAEVRAEKEKKDVAKETSAAMTKVAKAKVAEFHEAARREQADSSLDGPKTSKKKKVEKGQGQTKKTPKAIATVSKPNAKSKDASPPPTDENKVSARYFQISVRHSQIHL
jgi:hypothetical protein